MLYAVKVCSKLSDLLWFLVTCVSAFHSNLFITFLQIFTFQLNLCDKLLVPCTADFGSIRQIVLSVPDWEKYKEATVSWHAWISMQNLWSMDCLVHLPNPRQQSVFVPLRSHCSIVIVMGLIKNRWDWLCRKVCRVFAFYS